MATTDLGKWMITNGGEYNSNTTYEQLTMVLYQNSTYITLRTVTGIIPNNDKINYILMAQGFSANALGDVVAKDTYGVIGDVGGDVSAQNLVDYLTNEVVNNLLKKTSISTVQANSDNTVPSSSLAYAMQQEITKNKEDIATENSNLGNISDDINPLKSNYVSHINVNVLNKVNLVLWDANTADTPFKAGNTVYGNGFCITYSSGVEQWLCQLAMAVGDSHLFTRHQREGVWSGWTTIGSPSS
jgi:hypothetical protein